jgi:DNA-binding FadR family transcriptional regulator
MPIHTPSGEVEGNRRTIPAGRQSVKQFLKPITTTGPKEEVVRQIEALILSGQVRPGEKLPAERELAERLGVSRPVVHEGIVDLAQKGLVEIKPRHGVWVNDYRLSGSAELLYSLWHHRGEEIEPDLIESMGEFRVAVEQEAAARLASGDPEKACDELEAIAEEAERLPTGDPVALAEIDYRFHFTIALHCGNIVYPMLMNSFRRVYLSLLERFFRTPGVDEKAARLRRELIRELRRRDADAARAVMYRLSREKSYE